MIADPRLRARIEENLAGFDRRAHADPGRVLKPAAVAVVVTTGPGDAACFVLTRRAGGLRRHSGQYALPGGRLDTGETTIAAALRELDEELGARLDQRDVLGLLDEYPTRSGYTITPVVVWGGPALSLHPAPDEVADVHRIPLSELSGPDRPRTRTIPESDRPIIYYPLLGTTVHAPTAAILHQFHEVCLEGRPTRVVHYDQPVFAWR